MKTQEKLDELLKYSDTSIDDVWTAIEFLCDHIDTLKMIH